MSKSRRSTRDMRGHNRTNSCSGLAGIVQSYASDLTRNTHIMRLKSTDVDGDCRYTTSLPLFYFSGLNPNEEEKFVKDASHNSSTYEYANLRCSDKLLHIFHTASEPSISNSCFTLASRWASAQRIQWLEYWRHHDKGWRECQLTQSLSRVCCLDQICLIAVFKREQCIDQRANTRYWVNHSSCRSAIARTLAGVYSRNSANDDKVHRHPCARRKPHQL